MGKVRIVNLRGLQHRMGYTRLSRIKTHESQEDYNMGKIRLANLRGLGHIGSVLFDKRIRT